MSVSSECVFCRNLPKVLENDLAFGVYDIHPISKGHMVFIVKRHHENLFSSNAQEVEAMFALIRKAKDMLDKEYGPHGYNIQANCGAIAGQTVMHAHMHLIPRYY